MIKLIWHLPRIAGITHEQFREHYENVHSRLGKKHIGPLLCGYVRNYPSEVRFGGSRAEPGDWTYDCIAEWHVADEAMLEKVWERLRDPQVSADFKTDEPNFLDVSRVVLTVCREGNVVDTGTVL